MATNPRIPEGAGSHTGPGRLRRSLDTLRVKLFLAIAGANLVLVMAVYLTYSWTFDKGLVDYVTQNEQARLAPVISRLAEGYRQNGGSWRWLTDDRTQWDSLLGEVLGWRFGRRDNNDRNRAAPGGQPGGYSFREIRPPTRDENVEPLPPIFIDWRLMLFDESGAPLIPYQQKSSEADLAVRLPIRVDGRIAGHLGYIPRLQLVESIESITARQQSKRFGVIALGMLAAVLLNAALISQWLSRRLRAVGQGAAALAQGDYAMRMPVRGNDELARLASDFNHLAEALEAAQHGRRQWIADIAHELRTPLTTLRAEIEAVQDGVRPLTQASIASVAQEVHRLTRLVEDLRVLSLSDLGALTYRKEPVHPAETIADVLSTGRAAIDEQRLAVQCVLDPDVVIDADEGRLAQVFANLLQNTLRYSEAPAKLRIELVADGQEARIDWEDSPPGVPDSELGKLTDRLYRVDESRSSASGGSGLGLAIVQAIVNAHGGRMEPGHSSLGGLRWRIWLPLSSRKG